MFSSLTLAALLAAASPPSTCVEIAGIEQLLGRRDLNYLLLGEYHGTVEMPAMAADVLCHAARTGRPLVLALEFTPQDQPAFDLYMASDGEPEAKAALLASPGWKEEGGRTTAAIARLVESARLIGLEQPVALVAFDIAPQPGTSPRREAAMAKSLTTAAARKPDSLVVVFTGAGHADKEGFTSRRPPFLAAAGHLPEDQTVSLAFARPGGQYWGCSAPDGDASRGCAVYDMPAREPVAPRGIMLDPKLRRGFDGLYHPGSRYTPSRPAVSKWERRVGAARQFGPAGPDVLDDEHSRDTASF